MTEEKIECGNIVHDSETYIVLWEQKTGTVWTRDKKGYSRNYGDAKAENKVTAIECAKEMLRLSGS